MEHWPCMAPLLVQGALVSKPDELLALDEQGGLKPLALGVEREELGTRLGGCARLLLQPHARRHQRLSKPRLVGSDHIELRGEAGRPARDVVLGGPWAAGRRRAVGRGATLLVSSSHEALGQAQEVVDWRAFLAIGNGHSWPAKLESTMAATVV